MLSSDSKHSDYIPDFSLRAITEVQYLCVHRAMYIAALRTTRMLRQSGNITVHDAFEAEYEKVKSGESRSKSNSVCENYSPPLYMTLDALKNDESAKKKSTASLDRLTFFHRKNDSLENQNRMRRTGSDAKDRSPEHQEEFDRKHTNESSDVGSSPASSSPNADSKRSAHSFSPYNSHKLNFVKELADNGAGGKDEVKRTYSPERTGAALAAATNGEILSKQDLKEAIAGGDVLPNHQRDDDGAHEKVPLVVIKPVSSGGQKSGANSTGLSQTSSKTNRDAERVPLMNRDAVSDEFSSP